MRVLVVDDSVTILKMTKMAIEFKGHIVETATTGLEAKNKMCEKEYDVVLMDFQMPVMGGIEATSLFRKFEICAIKTGVRKKKQLIIGMSAANDYEMWLEAMVAGMEDFIKKPFNLVTFINIVASINPELKNNYDSIDGSLQNGNSFPRIGDSQNTDNSRIRFLDISGNHLSNELTTNIQI
jgi:CheY-like chemotaxis protein